MTTTPKRETVEEMVQNLRLKMRIGCDCKSCRENNENLGEGCVIRTTLTSLHQQHLEEKEQAVQQERERLAKELENEKEKWKPGRLSHNARRSGLNDAIRIVTPNTPSHE